MGIVRPARRGQRVRTTDNGLRIMNEARSFLGSENHADRDDDDDDNEDDDPGIVWCFRSHAPFRRKERRFLSSPRRHIGSMVYVWAASLFLRLSSLLYSSCRRHSSPAFVSMQRTWRREEVGADEVCVACEGCIPVIIVGKALSPPSTSTWII
jgi:hypothetical protein